MEQNNRFLTYDEKKAAEAAFRGLPFNPQWSKAAHKVYFGISSVMGNKRIPYLGKERPSDMTTIAVEAVAEAEKMSRIIG